MRSGGSDKDPDSESPDMTVVTVHSDLGQSDLSLCVQTSQCDGFVAKRHSFMMFGALNCLINLFIRQLTFCLISCYFPGDIISQGLVLLIT